MQGKQRRVVVTGFGMLTGLGIGVDSNWKNILRGVSGVRNITSFDASNFATKFAAEVPDFNVGDFMSERDARKNDRFINLGVAACQEAIESAGLLKSGIDKSRIGACIGSGTGGLESIHKAGTTLDGLGARRVSPFFVPGSIINMVAGNIAIMHGFSGPNLAVATACTTSTHSIGLAARIISYGDADVMLCGGAEAPICQLGIAGFNACRALSTNNDNPQAASRPWDMNRDGFVLGEGAGVLVLESEESAIKRGSTIYAEVCGFGMSDDAFHMTMPSEDGVGAMIAMQAALSDAGLCVEQLGYINAHATSTKMGDVVELQAIKSLFADKNKIRDVAVGGSKSMTGHLLGGAGAIEAIYTIKAIEQGVVPPNINLDNPESICSDFYLPTAQQQKCVSYAMSNSFGFGGTNAAIVFGSFA